MFSTIQKGLLTVYAHINILLGSDLIQPNSVVHGRVSMFFWWMAWGTGKFAVEYHAFLSLTVRNCTKPSLNATFNYLGKQRKLFRKTTCSFEVFKLWKIASECHVCTGSPSTATARKPSVNAAFTNSAKQKRIFRKTVCFLGASERRKTAREYHVFYAFTFNVIWLENLRQTPSLPTPANNRKTFTKTACSLGFSSARKLLENITFSSC